MHNKNIWLKLNKAKTNNCGYFVDFFVTNTLKYNGACWLVAIAGVIVLKPSHSCQVTSIPFENCYLILSVGNRSFKEMYWVDIEIGYQDRTPVMAAILSWIKGLAFSESRLSIILKHIGRWLVESIPCPLVSGFLINIARIQLSKQIRESL